MSKKILRRAGKKPWSKLQREIYKLLLQELGLQIHCRAYRMDSQHGSTDLPRYWINLDKEIIWDYPKDFGSICKKGLWDEDWECYVPYPYYTEISAISNLLREYINTPRPLLFAKHFADDIWGLTDILKAADRRLGWEKLCTLQDTTQNGAVLKVLNKREWLRK